MKYKYSDIDNIATVVCSYYNISKLQLLSRSRKKPIVWYRQVFHHLAYKKTDLSFEDIGKYFMNVTKWQIDHATVRNSFLMIENDILCNKILAQDIRNIESKIEPTVIEESLKLPEIKLEIINEVLKSQIIEDLNDTLKKYVFLIGEIA